jgi:hypothetical protein
MMTIPQANEVLHENAVMAFYDLAVCEILDHLQNKVAVLEARIAEIDAKAVLATVAAESGAKIYRFEVSAPGDSGPTNYIVLAACPEDAVRDARLLAVTRCRPDHLPLIFSSLAYGAGQAFSI